MSTETTTQAKPDPNANIPPAVRNAVRRSEALIEQARVARTAAPPGADAPLSDTLRAPAPTAPPAGVVVAKFDPNNPNPPDPTAGAHVTPPPPPAPPEMEAGDYQHQYASMKGRYERMQQDNQRMQAQIADMTRVMASLPPTAPPVQQSGLTFDGLAAGRPLVTEKERAEYGEEVLDVMGRRAREAVDPLIAQLLGEVNQIKSAVGSVRNAQVLTASERMYQELARQVPNWDEINNAPSFRNWLSQIDPMTGQKRHDLLLTAHNRNQSAQVIGVFQSFLRELGATQAPTVPTPTLPTAPKKAMDLAQFAAPGRAKEGQTSAPPEPASVTTSEITKFYEDARRGRYAGRQAEYDAIQRQIQEAINSNRIVRDR